MESLDAPPWQNLARRRIFWLGVGALLAAVIVLAHNFQDLPVFCLIAGTSLLPAFLWCRRLAPGIPIFPVFSLGTLWAFGFPLITENPLVMNYGVSEKLAAAATIAATNLAGCATWLLFSRKAHGAPTRYVGLSPEVGDRIFFAALVADIAFNVVTSSVGLDWDPAFFSLGRAVIQTLGSLAVFVLGYRAGQGRLGAGAGRFYVLLISVLVLSNLPSVLMVNALSEGALALMAFALGSGKLPHVALAFFLMAAFFLQEGKAAIREKYWSEAQGAPVSFARFPAFIDDWVEFSSDQLFSSRINSGLGGNDPASEPQSLIERASLLQLFLLIQRMSPAETPYLNGGTYSIIPRLLVPRIFNEDKPRTHLGTYLLAIHYQLQKPEDTSRTTIGFGLINEALANFGHAGCIGLGVLLGAFYGWTARWSSAYPATSLRALFAILVLTVSLASEVTAGVYVASLFQGACALLLLAVVAMRRTGISRASAPQPKFKGEPRMIDLAGARAVAATSR